MIDEHDEPEAQPGATSQGASEPDPPQTTVDDPLREGSGQEPAAPDPGGEVSSGAPDGPDPATAPPDPGSPDGAAVSDEGLEVDEGTLPPLDVRAILEALIFASPQPLTPRQIDQILGAVPRDEWQPVLEEIQNEYSREGRGLQLVEVAGGYQITTRPEYNDWVREILDPRTPTRLSVQALETLAVIAYRQPVTLPEVIELRGVKSGGVVKTLLEKRLVRITGRKEVVGRPMLYGTTKEFQLHFGLKDLSELPKIEEFADVLGEEVDVVGLKKAIEAPRPVEVSLSETAPEAQDAAQGPGEISQAEDGVEPSAEATKPDDE